MSYVYRTPRGPEKHRRDPAAGTAAKKIRSRAGRVLATGSNRFNLAVCFLVSLCGTGFCYAAISTVIRLLPGDVFAADWLEAAVLALSIFLSAPLRAGYLSAVSAVAAGKGGFGDFLKPFSSFRAFFRSLLLDNIRIFSIILPFFPAVAAGSVAADAIYEVSEAGAFLLYYTAPFLGAALCLPFSILTRRPRVFATRGLTTPDLPLSAVKEEISSLDRLNRAALFKNGFLHVLSVYASVPTVLVLSALHTAHLFALSDCLTFESTVADGEEQTLYTDGNQNE